MLTCSEFLKNTHGGQDKRLCLSLLNSAHAFFFFLPRHSPGNRIPLPRPNDYLPAHASQAG